MNDDAPAMVERRARIFRFGFYPAKRWGITAAEFVAANGASGTVPVGFDPIRRDHYEGEESALDGETGSAAFSVAGDEVMGKLRIPGWLDRAVRKHDLKLSATFHPTRKTINKVDFVARPHIPDAVLFAEEHGEVALFGDDEPEAPAPVEFADDGPDDHAQQMHELAAGHHPGLCNPGHRPRHKGDHPHPDVRMLHDYAVHQGGAYCPGMDGDHAGEVGMSDEIDDTDTEVQGEGVTFSAADFKAMQDTIRRLNEEKFSDRAVTFAEAEVREGRASVPERDALRRMYLRAALDDDARPTTVAFSVGDVTFSSSRVADLVAFQQARPAVKGGERTTNGKAPAPPARPGEVAFSADDGDPSEITAEDKKRLDALAASA